MEHAKGHWDSMRHYAIDPRGEVCPRHARLFELIRQQARARRVAERLAADAADRNMGDADAIAAVARRAAASWQKLS